MRKIDRRYATILSLELFVACLILTACGNHTEQTQATATEPSGIEPSAIEASALPLQLIVAQAPTGALDVVEARQIVQPGADIVIQGFVGGRHDPFVEGRAVLTLADTHALETCDKNPDDGCQTPWDACCEAPAKIKASIATVQVVDADGNVLKQDLKGAGGIAEQSMLTVRGQIASGSTVDSLVVNAVQIHVGSAL